MMEPTNEPEPLGTSHATPVEIIQSYLRDHSDTLLRVIHSYVRRFNTADKQSVPEAARELLSEVTIQALQSAERFDPTHQPGAWLTRIALNLARRRGRDLHARQDKELLASDVSDYGNDESELDLFDRFAFRASHPDESGEAAAQLDELLALATPEDRELLTRIDLEKQHYDELASQMGISEGTLRKRHYRAIQRLHQLASHKGGQPE